MVDELVGAGVRQVVEAEIPKFHFIFLKICNLKYTWHSGKLLSSHSARFLVILEDWGAILKMCRFFLNMKMLALWKIKS